MFILYSDLLSLVQKSFTFTAFHIILFLLTAYQRCDVIQCFIAAIQSLVSAVILIKIILSFILYLTVYDFQQGSVDGRLRRDRPRKSWKDNNVSTD